jgi:glutaredoxin
MIKKIIYIFLGIGFFVGLFWLMSQPPKNTEASSVKDDPSKDLYKDSPVYDNPDLVFYWGNGCPHCENVEKWLKENNSNAKIKVNYKEVYFNSKNQAELATIAKQYCPELITADGIYVPMSLDPVNKKCIQGDTPIIEFLSTKLAK